MRLQLLSLFILLHTHISAQGLFAYESDGTCQQRVNIQIHGHDISSLCYMQYNTGEIVGSIINEFGIKAFDFRYDVQNHKSTIMNVMKPLNRRMLRRVISRDFGFLFSSEAVCNTKHMLRERQKDGTICMTDAKYKISYTFTPLPETLDEAYK